ncbi:MAG: hypothetical protein JW732_03760 [Dehalococcoidia bacterium]|nr:hypothetical protein [Dehalococcoidia bacterium]
MLVESDIIAGYGDGCSLAEHNFRSPELIDALFQYVPFLGNLPLLFEVMAVIFLGVSLPAERRSLYSDSRIININEFVECRYRPITATLGVFLIIQV